MKAESIQIKSETRIIFLYCTNNLYIISFQISLFTESYIIFIYNEHSI